MLKKIVGVTLILLVFISFSYAQEEQLTITTYYPSPHGSYRELRAQRMAIGNTYYDSGAHPWDKDGLCLSGEICDADLVVEGNVGIGVLEPKAKLHVDAGIIVGGGSLSGGTGYAVSVSGCPLNFIVSLGAGLDLCSATNAGEIRVPVPVTNCAGQAVDGLCYCGGVNGASYSWRCLAIAPSP